MIQGREKDKLSEEKAGFIGLGPPWRRMAKRLISKG
jgi:hypothetical protein